MDSSFPNRPEAADAVNLQGRISLFGFQATEAVLVARPRSVAWRAGWAVALGGGGVVLAGLLALVPPHAPWVVGALGVGSFLGLWRWRERFSLVSFRASCPRCGQELALPPGTPVRRAMSVSCDGCRHDSTLTVSLPG